MFALCIFAPFIARQLSPFASARLCVRPLPRHFPKSAQATCVRARPAGPSTSCTATFFHTRPLRPILLQLPARASAFKPAKHVPSRGPHLVTTGPKSLEALARPQLVFVFHLAEVLPHGFFVISFLICAQVGPAAPGALLALLHLPRRLGQQRPLPRGEPGWANSTVCPPFLCIYRIGWVSSALCLVTGQPRLLTDLQFSISAADKVVVRCASI